MGYVKPKAYSKAKIDMGRYEQLKDEFLLEIRAIVTMDETPPELIITLEIDCYSSCWLIFWLIFTTEIDLWG